jgi:hypothetical protein
MTDLNDTTALTAPSNKPLNPQLRDIAKTYQGVGVSFDAADQILPLINVAQNGSPIVNQRDPAYIAGASAGDFWIRDSRNPIRSGITGIELQFCGYDHVWIEWRPNRQGFAGRHNRVPDDATETRDENGRTKLIRGNGNSVEETREFFVLLDLQPYILPCAASKNMFAKRLMTWFKQLVDPETGSVLPAFLHKYRLTTIPTSNALGNWFGLKFEDLGEVSFTEAKAGAALADVVRKGKHRGDYQAGAE